MVCVKLNSQTPFSKKSARELPELKGVWPMTGSKDEGAGTVCAAGAAAG